MNCKHIDEKLLTKMVTWIEYDARGIPLGKVCDLCRGDLLKKYRPEVLTNPNYEADEPIEPEPEF